MEENENSGLRAVAYPGVYGVCVCAGGGEGRQMCGSMWGSGGKGIMSSALRASG